MNKLIFFAGMKLKLKPSIRSKKKVMVEANGKRVHFDKQKFKFKECKPIFKYNKNYKKMKGPIK